MFSSTPTYHFPFSTERINRLHHADPFSYQVTRGASPATLETGEANLLGRCPNEYHFDKHAQNAASVFPGVGTENRLHVIANARWLGRNTIKAIEGTELEAAIISQASDVGGKIGHAINHAPGAMGVAHGLASGGSLAAALHATPAIAAVPAINYGMNRINRFIRLRDVLSDSEAIKVRARVAGEEAKVTRETLLDQGEEVVLNMNGSRRDAVVQEWHSKRSDLKEHAYDFDTLLPRYLTKLQQVGSGGGNVAKKFAGDGASGEIGVTPIATGLKLANFAEDRVTIRLSDLFNEANAS